MTALHSLQPCRSWFSFPFLRNCHIHTATKDTQSRQKATQYARKADLIYTSQLAAFLAPLENTTKNFVKSHCWCMFQTLSEAGYQKFPKPLREWVSCRYVHIQEYVTAHWVITASALERGETEKQSMGVSAEVQKKMNFCAMYLISPQKCIYQGKYSHLPAARWEETTANY